MFLLFFTLFVQGLSGNSYLSLPPGSIIEGKAVLLEDTSPLSRRGTFHLFYITSDMNITAGTSYELFLWLPSSDKCHYKGELVELNLNFSTAGKLKINSLLYSEDYKNKGTLLRADIIKFIRRKLTLLGEPGNMLEALLLGKTDKMYRESDLFREAGVSHLLALSGLHRGIITGLFILILRPLIPRRMLGPLVIIILCGYTWIIGTKHSLIRAMLMYGLIVFTDVFHIKPSIGKILVCSLLIQVLLWNDCYLSLSFQLSYLAMGGIIFFTQPCSFMLKRIFPSPLALVMSVSISAQLALIPLLLTTFGEIHLWGIIAGILLTPLITIYIWSGIILLPFILTSKKVVLCINPLFRFLYWLTIKIVEFFAQLPVILKDEWLGRLLFFLSISVMIGAISLLLLKESAIVRKNLKIKLRLSIRNKISPGNDGIGSEEKMGPEFSD